MTVELLIDDVVVSTKEFSSEIKTMERMPISNSLNRGIYITFNITGTGKVYGIEYTVKGRDNAS